MALNNFGLGILMRIKDQASGPLGALNQRFGKFVQGLPPGIQGIGKFALALGPAAIAAGVLTVALVKTAKVIREATEEAVKFEAELAEISTLLDDTAMVHMPAIEKGILDMSIQFGKGTEDLTKATYQAISAGITAEKAGSFLKTAGKLAVGGVTDMETAVDGLTSIKNAWGLTLRDMTRVSDQMFVAMKAGKTTIGELSGAIGQVAPIAATMNIGLDQVLAMTATLTKGGITTSEAITGIRQAMVEVMRQTPKFAKAAKKYGIDTRAATVQEMGFANWISYANEKITEQGGKMTDMFRSVQGLTAMMTLAGKGMEDNTAIMEAMANAAGATEDAFAKLQKSVQVQQAQATQAQKAFMKDLGKMFLPMAAGWAGVKKAFWLGARSLLAWFKRNFVDRFVYILQPVLKIVGFVGRLIGKVWIGQFKIAGKILAATFRVVTIPLRMLSDLLRFVIRQIEKLPGLFERLVSWMAGWGTWMSQIWKFFQRIRIEFDFLRDEISIASQMLSATAAGEWGKVASLTVEAAKRGIQRKLEIAGLEGRRKEFQKDLEEGFLKAMRKRDETREAEGKDTPKVDIHTEVNIGDEKVGEHLASWEREQLIRNLEPVF